jgi:hypothetical protein
MIDWYGLGVTFVVNGAAIAIGCRWIFLGDIAVFRVNEKRGPKLDL